MMGFIDANKSIIGQRSFKILTGFFEDCLTLTDLGETYGLSRERTAKIIKAALRRIYNEAQGCNPAAMHTELSILRYTAKQYDELVKSNEQEQYEQKRLRQVMEDDHPVEMLALNTRARNVLTIAHIHTIGHLCNTSEKELMVHRQCGIRTLTDIKAELGKLGLSLRG